MKIVVDVPDEEYESYALAITFGLGSAAIRRILDGTPLPKGYGRLIDADELKKRFAETQAYIKDGECAEAFYAHGDNLATEWDCVEDIVDSMPTVEERKGKWIDEGWYADGHSEHAFHCSLCGGHIIDYVCQVYDENPHCKWCGAKMEGAEK